MDRAGGASKDAPALSAAPLVANAHVPSRTASGAPAAQPGPESEEHAAGAQSETEALLQVRLLAVARAVFQMTRICMGPLMVDMAAEQSYTAEQKGLLLSAFAGGYAMTQIVGGIAADKFGGAPVIFLGLLSSSAALLMLPFAARAGFLPLWWLLWAMGFTQGPTYPAQLVNTAKWATGSLRSYASALGAAGSTAGSLLALGLTAPLASRLGWHRAAAAMGLTTLSFGVLWAALGRSGPTPIAAGDGAKSPASPASPRGAWGSAWRMAAKYVGILSAAPVLAVFSAHSVHNFVRYFLMAWMPTYYREVLGASHDASAVLLLTPELVGLLVSIGSAHLGRHLQRSGLLTALASRRLFASTAFVGAACGLWMASEMTTVAGVTACLCLVQGLATLQGLGYGANYLDVSKYNGGVVTGVGNTVATGASFLAPIFASWVLSSEGSQGAWAEDWRHLFHSFAASNILGVAIFVPLCSVTPVDLLGAYEDDERADVGQARQLALHPHAVAAQGLASSSRSWRSEVSEVELGEAGSAA